MKKTGLTLAVSGCLLAGVTHAGGALDFPSLYSPANRIIVHLDQTMGAPNIGLVTQQLAQTAQTSMSYVRSMALPNRYVYELGALPKGMKSTEVLQRLQALPSVVDVEIDARMQPMSANDTRYNEQWHYFEPTGGINLPAAWGKSTGQNTIVAVLDTGHVNHSDLNANIIGGYDFISSTSTANDGNGRDSDPSDPGDWSSSGECGWWSPARSSSWHGTHVSGTIAAVTNNNRGVAGVAYDSKILSVRVLGKCGGSLSDISDAIVWASGGSVSGVPTNSTPADVINMSLGGSGSCGSTYQAAINTAVNNGTVVVVAAGNSNANADNYRPAGCKNVISVASTDRQGNRASYSNFGSVVDVAAPGGETATTSNGVLSTLNSGSQGPASENYAFYQGTSMASPHVAGVAALMRSVNPSATPADIEAALKSTARSLPGSCSGGCGAGIVDASAAIDAISGSTPPPPVEGGTISESNLSASRRNWLYFTVEVPAGMSSLEVNISGGSGDADLYVRRGSRPTTSSYNCRPYRYGNNENCNFGSPAADTWHIGIRAYSSFSGVNMTATWE